MGGQNAFIALCALADRERWCWNIGCTTCGHGCFRYGFYEIGQGRHPDAEGWLTHKDALKFAVDALGDIHRITAAIQQSRPLYDVLAEASLSEIAGQCHFPDYLGCLGLGLAYTARFESDRGVLTDRWGRQLLEMVNDGSAAASLLRARIAGPRTPLKWSDLSTVELDMRPDFRGRAE